MLVEVVMQEWWWDVCVGGGGWMRRWTGWRQQRALWERMARRRQGAEGYSMGAWDLVTLHLVLSGAHEQRGDPLFNTKVAFT